MPLAFNVKNRAAFEFSKRKFAKKYGPDLPVWALLASGSTGGVSLTSLYSYTLGRIQNRYRSHIGYPPTLWVSQLTVFFAIESPHPPF